MASRQQEKRDETCPLLCNDEDEEQLQQQQQQNETDETQESEVEEEDDDGEHVQSSSVATTKAAAAAAKQVSFGTVSLFTFKRQQGFQSIPSDGESGSITLGMARRHHTLETFATVDTFNAYKRAYHLDWLEQHVESQLGEREKSTRGYSRLDLTALSTDNDDDELDKMLAILERRAFYAEHVDEPLPINMERFFCPILSVEERRAKLRDTMDEQPPESEESSNKRRSAKRCCSFSSSKSSSPPSSSSSSSTTSSSSSSFSSSSSSYASYFSLFDSTRVLCWLCVKTRSQRCGDRAKSAAALVPRRIRAAARWVISVRATLME